MLNTTAGISTLSGRPGGAARPEAADASSPTLGDWFDEWMERCEARGLRATTIASYRAMVRLYVARSGIATKQLPLVTAGDLNRLYADLLQTGGRNRNGLSVRSVRYVHALINKALTDAVRRGQLGMNPASGADPPSPRAARARPTAV